MNKDEKLQNTKDKLIDATMCLMEEMDDDYGALFYGDYAAARDIEADRGEG